MNLYLGWKRYTTQETFKKTKSQKKSMQYFCKPFSLSIFYFICFLLLLLWQFFIHFVVFLDSVEMTYRKDESGLLVRYRIMFWTSALWIAKGKIIFKKQPLNFHHVTFLTSDSELGLQLWGRLITSVSVPLIKSRPTTTTIRATFLAAFWQQQLKMVAAVTRTLVISVIQIFIFSLLMW